MSASVVKTNAIHINEEDLQSGSSIFGDTHSGPTPGNNLGRFHRSIFSDNLQPIATRGKKARGTLLVDIGFSSKRAPPPSVSYYNEISSGHIGSCCCE